MDVYCARLKVTTPNIIIKIANFFKKFSFALLYILFASNLAYSKCVTVYGLSNVKAYQKLHPNVAYMVQLASFSIEKNAIKYKDQMQKSAQYPLKIITKLVKNKNVYAVVLGPIVNTTKSPKVTNDRPLRKLASASNCAKTRSTESTKQVEAEVEFTKRSNLSLDAIKNSTISTISANHKHQISINKSLKNSKWYLSVGGGEQFPNSLNSLQIENGSNFPNPYDKDIYSNSNRNNSGVFTITGGRIWETNNSLLPAYSLGVMWQYLFRNKINGQITEYSDPTFLNYNYQLNTLSNVILAYSKINLYKYKNILPYFNFGLGSALNKAKNYYEEALDSVTPRVSPQYQTDSNTQFAYLLGAGIDIVANENFSLSAGYNYLNIGHIASGYGVSTWSATKLSYNRSSTNEILITLNYKFPKNLLIPFL